MKNEEMNQSDWLADWLTDWLTFWLTDWLTDWLTSWLTDGLTDWLADWMTDWLTDELTEWPTDWLTYIYIQTLLIFPQEAFQRHDSVSKYNWVAIGSLISSFRFWSQFELQRPEYFVIYSRYARCVRPYVRTIMLSSMADIKTVQVSRSSQVLYSGSLVYCLR